jgi:hypothetical protein
MKISLAEQIPEAECHRDELQALIASDAKGQAELHRRLHRSEGIVLTLRWLETYEIPFRAFMAQRSKDVA